MDKTRDHAMVKADIDALLVAAYPGSPGEFIGRELNIYMQALHQACAQVGVVPRSYRVTIEAIPEGHTPHFDPPFIAESDDD